MLDLSKCWTSHAVAVIDFETCGLNPSDGACEVACIRFEEGRAVEMFTTLLNPGRPIPAEATAIHGITDAMVADAPTLLDVAGRIAYVCRDAVPCAYSASFDRGFLHAQITGKDCPAFDPEQPWIDPLVIVKKVDRFVSGAGRHKLSTTCERYGVKLGNAHRASADAVACGELLYAMLAKGVAKPAPIGKMLAAIEAMRAAQESERAEYVARASAGKGYGNG